MNTKYLVDPEIAGLTENLPKIILEKDKMPFIREELKASFASIPQEEIKGVIVKEEFIQIPEEDHKVRVLIYTPENNQNNQAALLFVHGGGYVIGTPEMSDTKLKIISKELGVVIVSVDYRLAPEYPFPTPQEDCYTALKWFYYSAENLGIDKNKIAIYGESAGGGLCATLAIMARDRNEIPITHQFLIYPMLDDRTCVEKTPNPFTGEFIWTREKNFFGWNSILGKIPGSEGISAYAAAARVEDVTGLPSTYIAVGALDLFLDENISYAHRLLRAGIPTELHVYPGAFHGFDSVAMNSEISKQFDIDLRRAFKKYLLKNDKLIH
jgi:acetyl esterase/lipase